MYNVFTQVLLSFLCLIIFRVKQKPSLRGCLCFTCLGQGTEGKPAYFCHACMCAQSCLTLCDPMPARLLCPWDSPGKNTGVGCHFLSPGKLPDPGIEPGSPAWQVDSLPRSHWEARICVIIFLKKLWMKHQSCSILMKLLGRYIYVFFKKIDAWFFSQRSWCKLVCSVVLRLPSDAFKGSRKPENQCVRAIDLISKLGNCHVCLIICLQYILNQRFSNFTEEPESPGGLPAPLEFLWVGLRPDFAF